MFADLDGTKLYYEITGEGEPVLLISGINANHRFWKGMIPLLEGYKIITVDNPGVGQTEYTDNITIDGVADLMVKLIDHLGMEKVHLVGWSWGSQIAQSIAIRYGERLQTLTLVSSYQFRPYRSAYFMGLLTSLAAEGQASMDVVNICFNAFCFPETMFQAMLESGNLMPLPKHPEDPKKVFQQAISMDKFDTTEKTKDINVPTLVVHGGADIMVEPIKGRAIGDSIPGAIYVEIPGVGHTIPPEYYAKNLRELLQNNKM